MGEEIKKIDKKMSQFVVIGLGKFGKVVATNLVELGNEVLVMDTNPEEVKKMEGIASAAVVADATSTDVLHSLGVRNFDCVIICIGHNLQSSILTTLICKDLGVKYVVAKAQNDQHKKVLERIGADMVVFPEVYMGKKVASMLDNPSMNEIMSLTDNYKIVEIPVPDSWCDKTIKEIDIRKKHKISVIFIKRGEEVISPEPETQFLKGDLLIISGDIKKIETLSNKTSEVLDLTRSLQDALESE